MDTKNDDSEHGILNSPPREEEFVIKRNVNLRVSTASKPLKMVQSLQANFHCFKDENNKETWEQHELNKAMIQTLANIRNMHPKIYLESERMNK